MASMTFAENIRSPDYRSVLWRRPPPSFREYGRYYNPVREGSAVTKCQVMEWILTSTEIILFQRHATSGPTLVQERDQLTSLKVVQITRHITSIQLREPVTGDSEINWIQQSVVKSTDNVLQVPALCGGDRPLSTELLLLDVPGDGIDSTSECSSQFESDIPSKLRFNLPGQHANVPHLGHSQYKPGH